MGIQYNNRCDIRQTAGREVMTLGSVSLVVGVLLAAAVSGVSAGELPPNAVHAGDSVRSVPFTKNMGQWPDSILYRANAGGATMWFTNNGVYYQFTRRIATDDDGIDPDDPFGPGRMPGRRDMARDSVEMLLIKAQFEGADPRAEVIGLDEVEYRCNYFLGNDPAKWRSDVPNYRSIVMREVYPGVDVHFEGSDRGRLVYRYERWLRKVGQFVKVDLRLFQEDQIHGEAT
jgi:hypothetical protein